MPIAALTCEQQGQGQKGQSPWGQHGHGAPPPPLPSLARVPWNAQGTPDCSAWKLAAVTPELLEAAS